MLAGAGRRLFAAHAEATAWPVVNGALVGVITVARDAESSWPLKKRPKREANITPD
jgi:hypothetical protein